MQIVESIVIKCQYCIERQLEPEDAIGLYLKLPICDKCLGPMLDNKSSVPLEVKSDKLTFHERRELALKLLDAFEEMIDSWPLTADETLRCHEDFYNHKPPALINCDLRQIEELYARRKGILFMVRHKDERWANDIDRLKQELRERANLTGIQASKKEKGKIVAPSAVKMEQIKKTAKILGVSVESIIQQAAKAKQQEFEELVGSNIEIVKDRKELANTSAILSGLKKKTEVVKPKINPFTGKPY